RPSGSFRVSENPASLPRMGTLKKRRCEPALLLFGATVEGLLRRARLAPGPGPGADLPTGRTAMQDEGHLTVLDGRPAVLLEGEHGRNPDVGDVAFDFRARRLAVFDPAVGDAGCFRIFLEGRSPFLGRVPARPTMRSELVDDSDVAGVVSGEGGL